jgi:hypothetical protein
MGILEKVDAVMNGMSEIKSDIGVFGVEQYNKGWDEAMAQAGSGGSSDKIYSEIEMNQIIADTKVPLQADIDSLKQNVEELKASIPGEVEKAMAEFKAILKAKYDEQQVVESTSETGFGDLLK